MPEFNYGDTKMKHIQMILLSSVLALTVNQARAGNITGLITFNPNTTAVSADVNRNFSDILSAVNDNDTRISGNSNSIGVLQSSVTSHSTSISALQADVATLQSSPVISGNLVLQEPSSASSGNIMKGSAPFLHDTGMFSVFVGVNAGNFTLSGQENSAVGFAALFSDDTGGANAAFGDYALYTNTTGSFNVALGRQALKVNATGSNNTAVGNGAMYQFVNGTYNLAIGSGAGAALTSGSNNVYIGSPGVASESDTIHIGYGQTATYIDGIYSATVASATGVGVVIDSAGQLGTVVSSRRFKDHIRSMGDASAILGKLHPVTFYYKSDHDSNGRHLQYGLVAEDVAKVAPGLVAYGKNGKPEGVYYRFIAPMLLNEYQKQQRIIAMQTMRLKRQAQTLREQSREIVALKAQASRVVALETKVREIDVLKREIAQLKPVLARR